MDRMHSTPIYGLVLCGGRSSRMGQDKGLLDYHGRPQREYMFAILERFCVRVFTSCRPEQAVPAHLNPLYDALSIESPINGIVTAFRAHSQVCWLTVAVDMPFVDDAAIRTLFAQRDMTAPATCFKNPEDSLPEPLCTIWETSAYPLLEAFVNRGEISPRKFLIGHHAHLVMPDDARVVMNVNTQEDRQRLSGH